MKRCGLLSLDPVILGRVHEEHRARGRVEQLFGEKSRRALLPLQAIGWHAKSLARLALVLPSEAGGVVVVPQRRVVDALGTEESRRRGRGAARRVSLPHHR